MGAANTTTKNNQPSPTILVAKSETQMHKDALFEHDGLVAINNEEYSEYDGMNTRELASSIAAQLYNEMPRTQKMMTTE